MLKKIISLSFFTLLATSYLFSQDMRIGVDYLSKIKIDNLSEKQRESIQSHVEDSFLDVIKETEKLSWNNTFTTIAQSKISEILREQKNQEDLSECTDTSCAITLGKLITAKYMIYRDISEIRPGEYNFRFLLINIETSEFIASTREDNYKGDVLQGDSIRPIFFDLMAELLNEAFPMENQIANSKNQRIIMESSQISIDDAKEDKEEKKGPNLLLIILGVLLLGAAASAGGGGGDGGGSGGSGTGGVDIGIEIP